MKDRTLLKAIRFVKYSVIFCSLFLILILFPGSSTSADEVPAGVLDESFVTGTGFDDTVEDIAIQDDGKIIVVGGFENYNGVHAEGIARLNPDGTLDDTFFLYEKGFVGASSMEIRIQEDGKILVGGCLMSFGGNFIPGLIRLNSDGTFDNTFDLDTSLLGSAIYDFELQDDGKIIAVGSDYVDGNQIPHIARFNSDGSTDSTFSDATSGLGASKWIKDILIQDDGKIVIGGYFTTYSGVSSPHMARLNSDGTLDETFALTGTGFDDIVKKAILLPNNQILVMGNFQNYNGTSVMSLAKLNSDGTLDQTFSPPSTGIPYDIIVQDDGKILVAGGLTCDGSWPWYLTRFNADGSLDVPFSVQTQFNMQVETLALDSDGKLLVGGRFNQYQVGEISVRKIARLYTETPEVSAPTGSISINNDDTYALSTTVTLDLSATDDYSGVDEMMVGNNSEFTDCVWEEYSTSKEWTLDSQQGEHTVYVKYKDGSGKISDVYNDRIILDTVLPAGTVSINSGDSFTLNTDVSLTLDSTDANQMIICNNSEFTDCIWEEYSTSKEWVLDSIDGTKTVYAKFKDISGNESTCNDTILLDTTAPTGSVSINFGEIVSVTSSVNLVLSATDDLSDVSAMMISNSSIFEGSTWEEYSTSKSWTLSSEEGTKTVYVKFKDSSGLISEVVNDTILVAFPVEEIPEETTPSVTTQPLDIIETFVEELEEEDEVEDKEDEKEITQEEINQVRSILLEKQEIVGSEINKEEGVAIEMGGQEISTKEQEVIHVYQESSLDLSIPLGVLHLDSEVGSVYAVLGDNVVKLELSSTCDSYVCSLETGSVTGEQNIEIITISEDDTTEKFVLDVLIDPYGYVYSINEKGNQERIKDATVTLYKIEEGERVVYVNSEQDNPQQTDEEGEYSFFVEPGTYILSVKADGYEDYESEEFEVVSTIIEMNIELNEVKSFNYWLIVLPVLFVFGSFVVLSIRKRD